MDKRGISGLLVSLIILLVVMTLIIFSTSEQFENFREKIDLFSLGKTTENVDIITNKCNLACHDLDEKTFCKTYILTLDSETRHRGSCEELADISSEYFSINKCLEIRC